MRMQRTSGDAMKFRVDGADGVTGEERCVVVEAETSTGAIAAANAQGMLAAEVTTVEQLSQRQTRTLQPASRRSRGPGAGVIALASFCVLLVVGMLGRGSGSSRSSNDFQPSLSNEQRKTLDAEAAYRRELRARSDLTGHSMSELDSAAKQFRANGVGQSDSERLRLAEQALRLKDVTADP